MLLSYAFAVVAVVVVFAVVAVGELRQNTNNRKVTALKVIQKSHSKNRLNCA